MKSILTDSFRKVLLKRAKRILKMVNYSRPDCEDVVQNAFYILIKYHDKLDTSNYERLINWLVTQESYRSIKLINRNKEIYFTDFDVSEVIFKDPKFVVNNDLRLDFKVLQEEFNKHIGLHQLNVQKHRRRIIKEYLNEPRQAQIMISLKNPRNSKYEYSISKRVKERRSKKLSI
tara:strand:- start:18889 stop:19413 length:525 start_codon:yes stop_codon:yes gene_type:complete